MPALRAARVKQQIVEIPEHEVVVAFVRAQAVSACGIELEQDLAVQQQREQLEVREATCLRSLLIFAACDRAARAAAMAGSQIRNNAPARGDSSTISLPRRRR